MDIKNIGVFLQNQRKSRGWTQSELAEMLQVSHQAISRWENGDNLPEVIKLVELGELYHLKVDQILSCDINDVSLSIDKKDFSRLSLYTTLNLFLAGLSIIVFFAMLFSTGKVWPSILIQYIIIITAQLIFVIPFSKKVPKVLNDYRHLRLNTIGSLIAVFITLIPSFIGFETNINVLMLAGVILIPISLALYLLNKALLYQELSLFAGLEASYHVYLLDSLKDNNFYLKILKNIFIYGVFYLFVYSFEIISDYNNSTFDYYVIYVVVISLTTIVSVSSLFVKFSWLNLFLVIEIFFIGFYINFLVFIEGVLTESEFYDYRDFSDLFSGLVMIFIIVTVLVLLGLFVFKKDMITKHLKTSIYLIGLFFLELALQSMYKYTEITETVGGSINYEQYGLEFEYNSVIYALVLILFFGYLIVNEIKREIYKEDLIVKEMGSM